MYILYFVILIVLLYDDAGFVFINYINNKSKNVFYVCKTYSNLE